MTTVGLALGKGGHCKHAADLGKKVQKDFARRLTTDKAGVATWKPTRNDEIMFALWWHLGAYLNPV
jgi:hypothetical protein